MHRLLAASLLCLSIGCVRTYTVPRPVVKEQVTSNFEKVLSGVVAIVGADGMPFCAGTLLVGDYVLTAYHCVDTGDLQYPVGFRSEMSHETGLFPKTHSYMLAHADPSQDLAVLFPALTSALPPRAPRPLAQQSPQLGERVFLFGHPTGYFPYHFTEGRVTIPRRIGVDGLFDSLLWFAVSAASTGGNSGGPCLNDDGEILGVTSWGSRSYSNVAGVVHYESVAAIVARLGE